VLSGGGVFGGDVADPKTGDSNPIGVKEQTLSCGLLGSALLEVSPQCDDRLRPEGTSAMFSAFAQKLDLSGPVQTQIAEFKLNNR